ncbi:hypothetical protein GMDG_07396, partial [Pseudogymnoascus destructans 20631-21]
ALLPATPSAGLPVRYTICGVGVRKYSASLGPKGEVKAMGVLGPAGWMVVCLSMWEVEWETDPISTRAAAAVVLMQADDEYHGVTRVYSAILPVNLGRRSLMTTNHSPHATPRSTAAHTYTHPSSRTSRTSRA